MSKKKVEAKKDENEKDPDINELCVERAIKEIDRPIYLILKKSEPEDEEYERNDEHKKTIEAK